MSVMNSMDGPDLDEVGGESARELCRALVSDALIDEVIAQAGDQGIALMMALTELPQFCSLKFPTCV